MLSSVISELDAASALLRSSLARYINACSAATRVYDPLDGRSVGSRSLLDLVIREIENTIRYEGDIRSISSILSRCRNSAFSIAPINVLPPEVLAHIFDLLGRSNSCSMHSPGDRNYTGEHEEPDRHLDLKANLLLPPVVVSQVCSRWRDIAFATQGLWIHIDVIISEEWAQRLRYRNELLVSRAGASRLKVHVYAPRERTTYSSGSHQSQLAHSSSFLGSRMKSFRLDSLSENRDAFTHVIDHFFRHLTPGALTKLILLDHLPKVTGVIRIVDPNGPDDERDPSVLRTPIPLQISMASLNEVLQSVKVLWQKNRYLPWASQVYSGLVDLRLLQCGTSWGYVIKSSELVRILISCPKIRIFHCQLEVDLDPHDIKLPTTQISLKDLEVLKLHTMIPEHALSLLTHLYPGARPLSMSLSSKGTDVNKDFPPPQLLDFFSRSNIENLFLSAFATFDMSLDRILSALPVNLRTLGFNGFQLSSESLDPDQSRWAKFNTLVLERSRSNATLLYRLVAACSIQAMILDSGDALSEGNEEFAKMGFVIRNFSREYGVDGNGWVSM